MYLKKDSSSARKSCPPDEVLGHFLWGALPKQDYLPVLEHIDQCKACQAGIERLDKTVAREAGSRETDRQAVNTGLNTYAGEAACEAMKRTLLDQANVRIVSRRRRPAPSVRVRQVKRQDAKGRSCECEMHRSNEIAEIHLPEQFGRYRVLGKLGQGGMGTVYLAHDSKLDRQVAVKTPRFDHHPRSDAVERFHRESRAMAKLHHRNVCAIHDVGQIGEMHFLTMEYIEGETLLERLEQRRSQDSEHSHPASPSPEASDGHLDSFCREHSPIAMAEIARKIALALQAMHEAGVVHRDLKPGNVIIDRQGEPIVTDFGLAQYAESADQCLSTSGIVAGTPSYMSPEQVEGRTEEIGPATDIYSLGVVLYYMLCGRLPFEGSTTSVLGQIVVAQPDRPTTIKRNIDPLLESICLKAMEKRIDQRYGSALEFAEAIERYIDSATRRRQRPSRWRSRLMWAALLSIIVLESVVIWWQVNPDRSKLVADPPLHSAGLVSPASLPSASLPSGHAPPSDLAD